MAKLGDVIRPAKVIRCNDNQYPILSMTMHDGIILQSSRFKKNLASVDQSNYKVVNYGQLVIGFPIDEGVLYIQKIVEKGIMSPAYNVWDVNYEIVDPDYLEFCLHSPQSMQYYKENLRGTTARRRSIPTDTLLKLPIYLPSLGEQRKIAMVLNQINNLIAKRRAQLDKLDLLVKARFVEMFCEERATENWPVVTIADISTDMRTGPFGSALRHSEFVESGVFVLGIDNAVENRFSYSRMRYITEEKYQQLKRYTVKPGDVIITIMGTVGRSAVIPEDIPKAINTKHLACLTIDKTRALPTFVCCAFQMHPDIRRQLTRQVKGAIMDGLNLTIIKKISLKLPSMDRQNDFCKFVEQTEQIKNSISHSLDKLEMLKKALMQKYFG